MKKRIIIAAMAFAAMSCMTSCEDAVTADELAEIVACGKLEFVKADHISVIADAAGRDNIHIEQHNRGFGTFLVVNINEEGRKNCAALLY